MMPHFSTANDLRRQQVLLQVLYIVRSFLHRNGIVQCSVKGSKQYSAAGPATSSLHHVQLVSRMEVLLWTVNDNKQDSAAVSC